MGAKEKNGQNLDVRLAERLLRLGKLSIAEHQAELKGLPDDEERAEYIEVYVEPSAENTSSDAETLTFT